MLQSPNPYRVLRDLVEVHSSHGVAKMAGCSYQTVYRAMRGDPPKTVDLLQGLSEVVGCEIGDWYDEELLAQERERRRKIEARRAGKQEEAIA